MAARGERLGHFLVEALDAVGVVRMDHRAGTVLLQQCEVLADRVIGLHLEAPPIGPDRRTGAVLLEQIGDLIGLHRVVEGGDVVAELLGHIHDDGHFIGAVAVVLDQNLARQHPCQRIHGDVAAGDFAAVLLIFVPFALIFGGARPGLAVDCDIAHAGRGFTAFGAINALRILAARHFEAVGRAGELHALFGAGIDVLDDDRAAAHQIGRAGQDLQRGDPAIDQRAAEPRILRPHAMFGPDIGGDRPGRFIAVGIGLHAGRGVIAQMAVNIDDAGGERLAGAIDDGRARRGRDALAQLHDLAIGEQHRAIVDPPAFAIEDGDMGDERRHAGIGLVGRGVRIMRKTLSRAGPGLGRGGGRLCPAVAGAAREQRRDGRGTQQRPQPCGQNSIRHESPPCAAIGLVLRNIPGLAGAVNRARRGVPRGENGKCAERKTFGP
ncbi:hypothetical protein D9M73_124590 [compost metagenome]